MTSIAFNLLGLALQLLIAAQQPNVPTEVRIQAVQTATYAIEYAQAYMPDEPISKETEQAFYDEAHATLVPTENSTKSVSVTPEEAPYGGQPADFGVPMMQEKKQ